MASQYTFDGVSLDDPGGALGGGPGVDGTCQFSIEGKVRGRPYYV